MSIRKKAEELERRRAEAKKMGGEARLTRQKERGKLDARARLDLLLDPRTFREIGLLATHLGKLESPTPADGVVCGTGLIEGRPVCVASYDFTVQGGSIGPVGERKVVRLVAAMVGPGAAGTAYIPGLADFVPMVRGTSSIAIGGPYLVKTMVGEDVTEEA